MACRFAGCKKNSVLLICQPFRLLKSSCVQTTQTHISDCIPSFIDSPKMLSSSSYPALFNPSAPADDKFNSRHCPAVVRGLHIQRHGCTVATHSGQGNDATLLSSASSLKQPQFPCQAGSFASSIRPSLNQSSQASQASQVRNMHAMQPDSAGGDDELDDGEKLPTVKWEKNNVNRISVSGALLYQKTNEQGKTCQRCQREGRITNLSPLVLWTFVAVMWKDSKCTCQESRNNRKAWLRTETRL